MAEFEVWAEIDYDDDIEIDFSKLDRHEKALIIDAILENGSYVFENIPLYFAGDIMVNIEPNDWR